MYGFVSERVFNKSRVRTYKHIGEATTAFMYMCTKQLKFPDLTEGISKIEKEQNRNSTKSTTYLQLYNIIPSYIIWCNNVYYRLVYMRFVQLALLVQW